MTPGRSDKGLPRTAVVGVLGGGQLGRMMALAAVGAGAVARRGQLGWGVCGGEGRMAGGAVALRRGTTCLKPQ